MLRDDYLQAQGLKVLRFSNREVLENIHAVLETVCGQIPLDPPLPKWERKDLPLCERGTEGDCLI